MTPVVGCLEVHAVNSLLLAGFFANREKEFFCGIFWNDAAGNLDIFLPNIVFLGKPVKKTLYISVPVAIIL